MNLRQVLIAIFTGLGLVTLLPAVLSLLSFGSLVLAYILPTLIAHSRYHRHSSIIALFNLLLGWTIIGWLLALFWAFSNFPNNHNPNIRR